MVRRLRPEAVVSVPGMAGDRYVTIAEAARALRVPERVVRYWIAEGVVFGVRFPFGWRVRVRPKRR